MLTKRFAAVLVAAAMVLGACSGSSDSTSSESSSASGSSAAAPAKLEQIRAYVPTTMAFGAPMIGFGKEGNLSEFSSDVSVSNWDNVEQLKSALMQGDVEVAAAPAYASANLYNRGVDVRLVGPVVWGMLYVVGPQDAPEGDWQSLKGKKVAVVMPGNMPDLVFSYLLKENGLDRDSDIEVVEANDGQQAIQLVATGQADYAVMPEHAVTLAERMLGQQGKPVKRVLNLQDEWAKVTGKESRIPMAGLVMPGELVDSNPELVAAVRAEVTASIDKANAGDEETIQAIAEHYDLDADVVRDIIPRLQLDMVPADDARAEYEDFLKRLGEVEPDIYGGKLPDDKFYAK
ncbi:MAG: ABC transporter substrate-binding protein [Actinomycetaceae bacterium]|nr:ABC transporter substrate-binding protein [Actinomycetaceae bacterium]